MSDNQHYSWTADIPLFKGMDSADLDAVMKSSTTRTYAVNQKLITQDDPSNGLYILLSGKLRVYIFNGLRGGATKVLAELGPGQHIGVMGLIDSGKSSASVETIEDSQVQFIPAFYFFELLETHPKFAKCVIDSLCDLLNSQQKLRIKSQNATLIKEKKLAPTLPNMRILCSIVRMHNNKISINK
jgi:CRP/FNR family cyclic AMP-dependent transcriptional regulator